jgi:hypothetical protein
MSVRVRVGVDPALLSTRALQAGLANVWVLVDTAVDTTFAALAAVVRRCGPRGCASSHPSVDSRRPTAAQWTYYGVRVRRWWSDVRWPPDPSRCASRCAGLLRLWRRLAAV